MIVYRKSTPLRIRRALAPEPPFWCATAITPYSARRASPVAIDYHDLRASASDRLEVAVCDKPADEIERSTGRLPPPVLIEATEFAEAIFRRGEEVLDYCRAHGVPAVHLVSTRGELPERSGEETTVIAAWPLELERLEALFAEAGRRGGLWGVAVPVLFPVTTDLTALGELVPMAKKSGASFVAAVPVEIDATAKQAIAQSLALDGDDETYAMLFHSRLEPIHVATERHIAALAADAGVSDFIVPPQWPQKSNWNAAVLLTLAATRLLAMEEEIDLAAQLARSARIVAELDKPIARIAEHASLSIVEALDAASVDVLTQWLERGDSAFVRRVNERWRLRRDAGGGS
ncbi:MAG TPA: hypothetical protein VLV78_04340 [Thermoanaerobaculia bacterium]|nr:hypothetical protein [Thermoanaerobaculia bacterium]